MAKEFQKWSWLDRARKRTPRNAASFPQHQGHDLRSWVDETNSEHIAAAPDLHAEDVSAQDVLNDRPRWLSDDNSPYGFSDDDGSLRQVDHPQWRRLLNGRKPKRFVPSSSTTGSVRWQNVDGQKSGPKSPASTRGSIWFMQALCAAALIGAGFYVHQGGGPWTNQAKGLFQAMFTKDMTGAVVPEVEKFLTDHHVTVPAFLPTEGTVRLHTPLSGTITQDYAVDHPEILLQGTAKEPVVAAGSGTVTKIVSLSSGKMVTIDHGQLGVSLYFGLDTVSVRQGQYVTSGQPIGRLPNVQQPQLRFAMERNGKYVNPHDDIVFPDSGA